jgi:hypothetical protein
MEVRRAVTYGNIHRIKGYNPVRMGIGFANLENFYYNLTICPRTGYFAMNLNKAKGLRMAESKGRVNRSNATLLEIGSWLGRCIFLM